MKLRYGSMISGDERAYPKKTSTVLYLPKAPFARGYDYVPAENAADTSAEEEIDFFLDYIAQANCEAVVVSGPEPTSQANALHELFIELKKQGYSIKLNTCGFYAEDMKPLLELVDAVSLEIKCPFDAQTYASALGFTGDPVVPLSNVFRSIAFLERAPCKREFVTYVIPSMVNVEGMSKVFYETRFAEAYLLKKPSAEMLSLFSSESPSPQLMDSLASEARKFIKNTVILS